MRRFSILQDWEGAHGVLLVLGLFLALFGVLVLVFPKLLVFILAAVCVTAGAALIQAAFHGRRSAREFREGCRVEVFSLW
jgi:uncharacterized membrane protein HdeD (DUF308 family)